jgi:SAM-dependent methyltransferase
MEMDEKKVKEYWNAVAASSTNSVNAGMLGPGTRFFEDYRRVQEETAFNELIDINSLTNVLEVGCGGGRWCFYLSDYAEHVTGIDISDEMIQLCKNIADEKQVDNIEFKAIDFLSLPENRKYGLIYFSGVLQYIDDETIQKILSKTGRLLQKDGVILSRDTVQEKQRVEKTGDYPVIYRTLQEYENLFNKAGYKMVNTRLAYENPRFSRIVDLIFYHPPVLGMKFALFMSKTLNGVNKLLGNPKWLMRKGLYEVIQSGNTQRHVFTKYLKD